LACDIIKTQVPVPYDSNVTRGTAR